MMAFYFQLAAYNFVITAYTVCCNKQIVYILDQVRALENEMLLRIQKQGLDVIPKILIVGVLHLSRTLTDIHIFSHFRLNLT